MSRFRPEPAFAHDRAARDGILLVNLGTPAAPTASAVRRYLAEFLSDPRVVEIPRPIWLAILYGVILNVRPARSAKKYALIWTPEGSPLAVHTSRQAERLSNALGTGVHVEYAMRYGTPAIGATLDRMRAAGCDRILVLPLYPQYAASTTGSTVDAVGSWASRIRNVPELRFVRHFHDDPAYIAALARSVRDSWNANGRGKRLVMSFHGLPQYSLDRGDPYHCECHATARMLADSLGLASDEWLITFQSRFGRAQWLQPYTEATLARLAREGVTSVDVICPGFVSDCLETLEEIGMEAKQTFLGNGGDRFVLIPCLNASPDWIDTLAGFCRRHAWPGRTEDTETLRMRADRSRALGAIA